MLPTTKTLVRTGAKPELALLGVTEELAAIILFLKNYFSPKCTTAMYFFTKNYYEKNF